MNRQQRRSQGHIKKINLNNITWPWQMTDEEIVQAFRLRLHDNMRETLHPFHHLTANGVIVTPDPTMEYYAKRLRANEQYKPLVEELERNISDHEKKVETDMPPAKPVNRKYYGHDLYVNR